MRQRALIIILSVFYCLPAFSQGLQFYKENLQFIIDKHGYFMVSGDYCFCNVSRDTVNKRLVYPFPVGREYGAVDSICVVNAEAEDTLDFLRKGNKVIYFEVSLPPLGIITYHLSYRQKLKGQQAEYILKTTQAWHKAFDMAEYRLTMPSSMKADSLSYKPDSSKVVSGKRH
ncbi:MAG: hypothetical protein ACQES1_05355 [Bacteroidota bacterium]